MPPGEDRGKLREMVATYGISLDFWFKLRGTLSQHAFSKHMTDYFEQTHVALSSTQGQYVFSDICQVWPTVKRRVSGEEVVSNQKSFNIDDFIWPHGVPPAAPSYQKETIQEASKQTDNRKR
jgi:transcription initiation factor TFIID subunit 7